MKKYFAGLTAIIFAIVCFAFSNAKTIDGPCDETLKWISIPITDHVLCTQDEIEVALGGSFQLTSQQIANLATGTRAQVLVSPYNACDDEELDEVCAVGYLISEDFEETSPGSGIFVFKANAQPNCCIWREEQP